MAAVALHLPCSSCSAFSRTLTRPNCLLKALPKALPKAYQRGIVAKGVQASFLQQQQQGKDGFQAELVQNREENWLRSSSMLFGIVPLLIYPDIAAAEDGTGYSLASYYTSLGLFVLALPGLWSLIKRSAKSKIVRKTYMVPGPGTENGKAPKQIAGEISSFFARSNFKVVESGEVVKFEGSMVPSRGQAAFLTFCTLLSLGSVALVLTITVPAVGDKWYWLTALSPLAGAYYWTRASRKEQIQVKMVVADDGSSTDIIVQGDDVQIERLCQGLGLMEKGMVYVKGILQK